MKTWVIFFSNRLVTLFISDVGSLCFQQVKVTSGQSFWSIAELNRVCYRRICLIFVGKSWTPSTGYLLQFV
jgi:hypothetical protein